MKKDYKALTQVAFSALLCVSLLTPASAQRGGQHSVGGGSSGGGTVQPQRSSPPPAPQPQVQRSAPASQPATAPQPTFQRPAATPSPAPQPQIQRNAPQQPQYTPPVAQPQQIQQSQPQMQRNNPQQGNNGFGNNPQRPNTVNPTVSAPRGSEHAEPLRFTPNNPGQSQKATQVGRGYGNNYGSNGNSFNNGFNFRRNSNSAYRSYPGLKLGRNFASPAPPRGFYYHNRGYYRTYYTPQLGVNLSVLPYGYFQFYYGNTNYYYSDGLYYMQDEDNYTVVEPPIGAVINKLPAKAQSIVINGTQYYELNGVYYQPVTQDDGKTVYQIAGKDGELNTPDETIIDPEDLPQVGDMVDHLPEGFKILRLKGQRFYVSQEGYYFQDAVDVNGDQVFKIVATPYETSE